MRTDFIEGGYNVYEHNHTEWTEGQLTNRLSVLAELNQDWQGEERRLHIQREMGFLGFELAERYREQKLLEIDDAWSEYGERTSSTPELA